jgi:hypothetical protein
MYLRSVAHGLVRTDTHRGEGTVQKAECDRMTMQTTAVTLGYTSTLAPPSKRSPPLST